MKYLLDTHALIWFMRGDAMLSEKAKKIILTDFQNCYVSLASFWEMSIKSSLNKLDLGLPFIEAENWALENGLSNFLKVEMEHINKLSQLPFHHRDPFDRTLIAQALTENLSIITKEKLFEEYGVTRIW
ncbi:type II toxin-antitoxin system VapC family toxin [Runella sp. SP2]|uniref:type II toxin-antitoxin system VapC family toxin n=1 Tax=Runella sp. SP2 TaxID=2268026 RepID=UPI000F092615|nr:type II toxin-antitoxin system VapC family toxin [Runella sp. SP2]AYQ32982.1 type II toxin-antitoxin system VapC family toxin [Runella sp. SP2]